MADGYILEIPEEVLKKLNTADEKIEQIAETSEKTQKAVKEAFAQMASGVDPFIERLKQAKAGMQNIIPKESSNNYERLANNIAKVSTQLDKVADSPIDNVNKKLDTMKKYLEDATTASQKLAAAKISGVIPKDTLTLGNTANTVIPEIEAQIRVLELQRAELKQNEIYWKNYLDNINGTSLAAQKQKAEMEQLNRSFRDGQSAIQRQVKAEDQLAVAANKVFTALDKAAIAQKKRDDSINNKASQAAAKAEEEYARALNRSEVTIVQRARKIEALANAQRSLTRTGKDYTVELSKIASETDRLKKANVDAANSMNKLKKEQSSVLNTTGQLTRKVALLFSVSAITGYVEKLIEVRGEFELQQRALQAILQNKDEANALFEKTVALAVKSPFQVKELVTYTKQLAAYRIESDKLYDTTKMLADVSAGLGVDMGRLILAYGQVKAANYLRASEVRQFTEAGVNILGELADIYTELEGRMVSVGEVQSRITKRMVAFGDVEKVFQRITSAGGIFYNMQEIQAETLAGMISNLKDNFDVMFNEIGKANDGVLKGFINIINEIVANWRYFGIALNAASIGFITYAAKIAIATAANGGFAASTIATTITQGGLAAALGKTFQALKGVTLFLRANPWVVLATVIAGAAYYVKDLTDKLDRTRATYDILNNQLTTQKEKLESLTKSVQRQISTQEKAEEALKNTKKGTDEYTEAENKANTEREKTDKLLNQLKIQYPEVYAKVIQNKDGIKSLANEQKKYNEELDRTITLNKLMQADVRLVGNSFKEQAEAYTESLDKQKKASSDLQSTYKALTSELKFLFKTDSNIPDYLKQNTELVLNSNDDIKKKTKLLIAYSEAIARHSSTSNRTLNILRKNASDSLDDLEEANKNRKVQLEAMNDSYESLRDNALKEANITLNEFKQLTKEQQQDLMKRMAVFIKSSAGAESVFARSFLKNRIKQDFNIEFNYDEKKVEKELDEKQKALAEVVNKYNNKKDFKDKTALKLPVVTDETTVEEYRDKIYKAGQALIDAAKENEKSIVNLTPHIAKVKEEAVRLAKAAGEEQKQIALLFGYIDKKADRKSESAEERRLKAQLSLLKQLQSQYEKLRQTQGEMEATKTLQKTFGDTFSNLFKKPITSIGFDKVSIANEADSIGQTLGEKIALSIRQAYDQYSSELRATATVTATVEGIKDIERQFDSMFNDYELYISLENKGLDMDAVAKMFDIAPTTLDKIRKKLEEVYPDPASLGQKQLDSYFNIQKKITDKDKEETRKRLNNFVEYLANSVDKIKQVQKSGGLEINLATDMFNKDQLNADQYVTIVKNVTDKVNKEVSKLNLEKFKQTPEYLQAMGDLSAYTTTELEALIQKMQQFISESAGSLNATDLKVYSDAIAKIQDQIQKNKSPFAKNAFAEYRQLVNLEKEYQAEKERQNQLIVEQAERIKEVADATQRLKEIQEAGESGDFLQPGYKDELAAANEEFQLANSNLGDTNNQLNISQGKLSNISGQIGKVSGGLGSAMGMVDKIVTGIYQSINATLDLMNQFKELAESRGIDTNVGGWREIQQAGELLGNVNERVMSSWNNFKSGNIAGAVADAIGSITTIFTTLNKQHDARREQTIQKEIKAVEDLQRAYEKLGKDIEKAYAIDTLNASNENAQRNIEQQIQSYERMIAAEEDKKKTDNDRIKEWRNTIEDLREEQANLRNKQTEELGGFGSEQNIKSAAQDFADAWLDAYRETGDGLSALTDKWDEYINNVIAKQLMLKGTEKFLKPIMDMMDGFLASGSNLTDEELDKLREEINKTMPLLNEFWKSISDSFKLPSTGDTELSGLQKGIESVTEETAQIVEALLNSIRFFTADSNLQLKNLYLAFTSVDPKLNPMYGELVAQTAILRNIYDVLNSVVTAGGNHPLGGLAVKALI